MEKDENVDDLEVYNLKKLKWILGGMIIPLVLDTVTSIFEGVFIDVTIIKLVGLIAVVLGLKGLSRYNSRFKTAYQCQILLFLIGISLIVAMLVTSSVMQNGLGAMMFICFIVIFFIIIGIEICFYYSFLKGIEEISRQVGEEDFANKIEKFWYTLIWTGIIVAFCLIFFIIFFDKSLDSLSIIMNIVLFFVNIILCIYIYKAYKLLDGREIPTEPVTCDVAALE